MKYFSELWHAADHLPRGQRLQHQAGVALIICTPYGWAILALAVLLGDRR